MYTGGHFNVPYKCFDFKISKVPTRGTDETIKEWSLHCEFHERGHSVNIYRKGHVNTNIIKTCEMF